MVDEGKRVEGPRAMDFDDIERIVHETLALGGTFVASKYVDHGYLSLVIQAVPSLGDAPRQAERTQARIWTSGAEAFFLELDEHFDYKEFDWELEGQRDILRLLTKLGMAYLQGKGVEKERKISFGRHRLDLEIELEGHMYRFDGHGGSENSRA